MKTLLIKLVLPLTLVSACTHNQPSEESNLIKFYDHDVKNFWSSFDLSTGKSLDECTHIFKKTYFEPGSSGLKDFYKLRIESDKSLCQFIEKFRPYYSQLRQLNPNLSGYSKDIIQAYNKLKNLYPETSAVEVYYLIGKTTSAGTIKDNKLLIGVEMFASGDADVTKNTVPEHLLPYQLNFDKLASLSIHELIHSQQKYDKDLSNLLEYSIGEGSADFLTELVYGSHPNEALYKFGYENETKLKKLFRKKMNGKELKDFLYNSFENPHPDLGYFIGYRITEAFYKKSKDKKKAISQILNIKNFDDFLATSEYLK